MNRRNFLTTATGAACLGLLTTRSGAAAESAPAGSDDIVRELVRANDDLVPRLLARQERAVAHPWRGGVPNEHGIFTAMEAAQFISVLACASAAPESRYHRSAELVEPLQLAARFLGRVQHDDGTIDLISTNFHSPPDTGFVLEVVCPAVTILRHDAWTAHDSAQAELRTFIEKAAAALVAGGIHTPNHRWVISAALAWAHSLYPDARYVARIDQWLAETIDIDPDGQYTEKSTSIYSPVVDRCLLTMARLLGRPELREPVRRNLEMTLYYVHPDGEVVTEGSTRQDRSQRGSMARYYCAYRALAQLDGNGRFAAMARQIERSARGQLTRDLPLFLTEPELRGPLPADAPLPTNYAKVFAHSGLARIRRGDTSATILAGGPTFFSLRKGFAALETVRLATAFFGKGQFVGEKLEVRDGRYWLRQTLDGPYFQPLAPDRITNGEHTKMAPNGTLATNTRALRVRSNVQTLESVVVVSEREGKFELAISIRGTAGVPVALELAFRPGGKLHGVDAVKGIADAFLLRSGTGRYVLGNDTIEFGSGRVEHTYTQLRDALPKWDGLSVYLTGFTPFQTTVTIA